MNRRQALRLVAASAAGSLTALAPRRANSQVADLIPTPYLAAKYVAPLDAPSIGMVAPTREFGERLVVTARALFNGRPVANVSIYAFHADADGYYTRDGRNSDQNARLFGTFRTDAEGQYRYETIRPSGYGSLSAHLHQVITAPGYQPRLWDLWLADDPILARNRLRGQNVPREDFVCSVTRDAGGVWHVTHDIPMVAR